MNKLKHGWTSFIGISAGEYSGFRLIVFTAIICWLGLALLNNLTKSPYNNYEKDAQLLDSLLLAMEQNQLKDNRSTKTIVLEIFDPNTASQEQLVRIGFPTWLATRLINYRATGARFNKAEDLLKLYGFPGALFEQLIDYVKIEPLLKTKVLATKPKNVKDKKMVVRVEEKLPVFDLNEADTAVFQTIKGIGSKLSNRIVSYRTALGGFISQNQLYQIYRLDSGVIEKLNNTSIIASDFAPIKININTFNKEQLAIHPYINWNQAKLIIAYRNQHGLYATQQDLLKVYSINENWVKKIAPYLTFQ